MIEHKEHFHGSDLEKIEKVYGIKKSDIVSFSANVNPLGLSPLLREELTNKLDAITEYPDREYTALRCAIGKYNNCNPADIIMGNGSTELISLVCKLMHPKKGIVVGPTYSEYEHEISLCGGVATCYPLKEDDDFALDEDDLICKINLGCDMLILCNPNNPTSTSVSNEQMYKILEVAKSVGTIVMVDETYVEFAPEIDNVTSIPLTSKFDNLIVLRGTSKFFAAPGLRLGYAVCSNSKLKAEISAKQNPWSINSLAEVAGQIMFSDEDYKAATRNLILSERSRLFEAYNNSGKYKAFYPTANFMLMKILSSDINSADLFDKCIKKGMMIRDCATFPFLSDRYIRICFMSKKDNDRLFEILTSDF